MTKKHSDKLEMALDPGSRDRGAFSGSLPLTAALNAQVPSRWSVAAAAQDRRRFGAPTQPSVKRVHSFASRRRNK